MADVIAVVRRDPERGLTARTKTTRPSHRDMRSRRSTPSTLRPSSCCARPLHSIRDDQILQGMTPALFAAKCCAMPSARDVRARGACRGWHPFARADEGELGEDMGFGLVVSPGPIVRCTRSRLASRRSFSTSRTRPALTLHGCRAPWSRNGTQAWRMCRSRETMNTSARGSAHEEDQDPPIPM